jgi:hypothetical protein
MCSFGKTKNKDEVYVKSHSKNVKVKTNKVTLEWFYSDIIQASFDVIFDELSWVTKERHQLRKQNCR